MAICFVPACYSPEASIDADGYNPASVVVDEETALSDDVDNSNEIINTEDALPDEEIYIDTSSMNAREQALHYGCSCPREYMCIEEALLIDEIHCIEFLQTLNYNELYALFAPFARVIDIMNERYGIAEPGHMESSRWMKQLCIHDPDGRAGMMHALSRETLAEFKGAMLTNFRGFWPSENWITVVTLLHKSDLIPLERVRIINLMSLYPETEQVILDCIEDGVCVSDVFNLISPN